MSLSAGDKVGHYQVLSLLGKGGMGEVYRARDTTLKRDVALKILPGNFANDPERMARFRREAEVLASLNHPNIAAIYGVEERALVMELVEGESPKGPLPFEEAWKIASQMADALAFAHEKSVVHRDLKPANIKVTPEGVVKLLDFGLAKAFHETGEGGSGDPSLSPTITLGATVAGTILGTAAYMAPEQAKARRVDKRADIWAWGVVLYELITGKSLFSGEDTSDTLAQVLTKQPDLEPIPWRARHLLQECLQKDPKLRLRDIGDAKRLLLPDPRDEPEGVVLRHAAAWAVAGVMGLIAAWGVWNARSGPAPAPRPLLRFNEDLGAELAISAYGPALAISPDGKLLVFVSRSDGGTHLSLRTLANSKTVEMAGTERAVAPAFSADSKWIAFFQDDKLKKISTDGGSAVTLCVTGANPRGLFWGEDNNILFATQRSPLMRVPSSGGTPQPATELDTKKGEVAHRFAQLLPGGEAMIFTSTKDNALFEDATIQIQELNSGRRKTLVEGGYFGRYVAGSDGAGYLLYAHDGTLFSAPLDVKRQELGPPLPALEDVSGRSNNGFAQLAVTLSGTVVYVPGQSTNTQFSLFLEDPAGAVQLLQAASAIYANPRVSPDGTRIAVRVTKGPPTNLAVYEWAQNRMTQLTFLKGQVAGSPTWSPDGKHIVFDLFSEELSGPGMYWMRADGAGEPQRLLGGQNWQPYSFLSDGKRLVYYSDRSPFGIWTLPLDLADPEHPHAGKPESYFTSNSDVRFPSLSADGRWVAYADYQTGMPIVTVRPFPDASKGKWQISRENGGVPSWSSNRQELSFLAPGGFWFASYKVWGDNFVLGELRPWADKNPNLTSNSPPQLMPDGQHAIVVRPNESATSGEKQTHVTFLVNFGEELKRRAPAGEK
jgi:Tol biopolymer transport system component